MQLTVIILLLAVVRIVNCQLHILGVANNLPIAVRLGSAIVAAVEEDAEKEQQMLAKKTQLEEQALIDSLANFTTDSLMARGKFHKQKKLIKYIYPLIMGMILAKTVLFPLLLKLLTAISTSSFVMSKISLAASALLFLKWIIGGNSANEAKERVEIIHVPVIKDAGGSEASAWVDSSWSGSNLYEMKNNRYRHNAYIPLGSAKDVSFTTAKSPYRYPQHNYNTASQIRRPFV